MRKIKCLFGFHNWITPKIIGVIYEHQIEFCHWCRKLRWRETKAERKANMKRARQLSDMEDRISRIVD